jgi:N-acylneuraminate cytidylyltransferase/CMP-N,N'-diacetyllegionaminic acid synthase
MMSGLLVANKKIGIMNEQILYYIPARGGSKGIPRKNLMEINGTSLVGHAVYAAKGCKFGGRIVVSTDSEEIAINAQLAGAEVPFIRSPKFSRDETSTYDTVTNDLACLETLDSYKPLILVVLQPTSPLRTQKDVEEAMKMFFDGNYDAVVSINEPSPHPYLVRALDGNSKIVDLFKFADKVARRQDMPKLYSINGAIYIIKVDVFRLEKTFMPINTAGYVMPRSRSIDIDSELDLFVANQMSNFNSQSFFKIV